MDRRLTDKQRDVLRYISEYSETNSCSPSYVEIGESMGGISAPAALAHVKSLERKGYVRRNPHQTRGIEVIATDEGDQQQPEFLKLPIVGEIAAGHPIEAYEDRSEYIWVEETLARNADNFVLRVKGHSMIGDGINDGDLVIVHPQNTAQNGETVVALIGGAGATLKRYYREAGHIRLQPAAPYLEPMIVTDVRIQGIAVGVFRRY